MSFRAKAIYVVVTTLFLVAFAIPLVGLAQKGGLEEFLGRVNEKLSTIETLSASFTQVRETSMPGQKMEASGKLFLDKPRKILLDYDRPERQKFLVSDTDVTVYVPSLKQVQKYGLSGNIESDKLFVFWEPLSKLQENFSMTQVRLRGTRLKYVELVPKDKKTWEGLERITLGIDPDLLLPTFIDVEEVGGDRVKMSLSDVKTNPKLDSSVFELKLPAGVEVVDFTGEENAPD
ncbi:MAG: outer membrane lipoprotein carrier protein LolA [Candidatus Eisenbacteria bacterium]|nr:outer membrane lipoprotein carrier protein LolA [Candidatus Eisenbacteria bacterium]